MVLSQIVVTKFLRVNVIQVPCAAPFIWLFVAFYIPSDSSRVHFQVRILQRVISPIIHCVMVITVITMIAMIAMIMRVMWLMRVMGMLYLV